MKRCLCLRHEGIYSPADTAPRTLKLNCRRKWVASFTLRPLNPRGSWYRCPSKRRLGVPQSRSAFFTGRNISPPRNRTTVSVLSIPQLRHCADYAILTPCKYHESWMRNQSVGVKLLSYCELLLIGFLRQVVFLEHWPLSSDLFACFGLVELLSKGEEPSMLVSSCD